MTGWQDIAAISLVGLAGVFVLWRAWRAIAARTSVGCGSGCGKCPDGKPSVLQIQPPHRSNSQLGAESGDKSRLI
jgi:hypothetical protein